MNVDLDTNRIRMVRTRDEIKVALERFEMFTPSSFQPCTPNELRWEMEYESRWAIDNVIKARPRTEVDRIQSEYDKQLLNSIYDKIIESMGVPSDVIYTEKDEGYIETSPELDKFLNLFKVNTEVV